MAKKKFIDAPEEVAIEPGTGMTGQEEQKIEEAVMEAEKAADMPMDKIDETTVAAEKLPDYAKSVFKLYPDADELYIDAKGGVFPKGTQPALVGSAILFKNPNINN